MLIDMNVTEEYLQELTHRDEDRIDINLEVVEIKDSEIEGKGIIAIKEIKAGDSVGIANIERKRTQIGRFTNHSDEPNAKAKIVVDKLVFEAIKDISNETEITVDYRQVREIANRLEKRLVINALYDQIESHPEHTTPEDATVKHHFSDGVYVREYHMEKNEVVVGKIHRHNHIAMLISGKAKVFSEEGEIIMESPHIWNSVSGERRAVFAIEPCIFVTVHPTDETDLDKIEEQVIAPNYEALEGLI